MLLALGVLACASPGLADYRPAVRWEDITREKYPFCFAEHDKRMAAYDADIGSVRVEIEDNEIEIRRLTSRGLNQGEQFDQLIAVRVELRSTVARLTAERPAFEQRSRALLLQCMRKADAVRKAAEKAAKAAEKAKIQSKPIKKSSTVIRGSGSTRSVTRTTRGTGSRYVTTGRSSGSRYVSTGRGVGGRVLAPTNRGYGSRGIGVRGIGGRGTATRCHHQPGTSQRHCGSG
jgi:hypothetical protein